jgi:23S rRNA pseudouridine1911/1915/1917 synthase
MLTVLYEDNHCLAVAKPAGLSTQAPPGQPSLEALARAYLEEKYKKTGRVYLGIPHRLDRPVSGVVLFARQTKSARRLAEQFSGRQVTKLYWAVLERSAVTGEPVPESGTWEDWLVKVEGQARAERAAEPGTPGAKAASLGFTRLSCDDEAALVEITPHTGRMHQIRVQAAARGWPVRGDALYGARLPFGATPGRAIALHARSLTFLHPIRYEPVEAVAEPDEELWRKWRPLSELEEQPRPDV